MTERSPLLREQVGSKEQPGDSCPILGIQGYDLVVAVGRVDARRLKPLLLPCSHPGILVSPIRPMMLRA